MTSWRPTPRTGPGSAHSPAARSHASRSSAAPPRVSHATTSAAKLVTSPDLTWVFYLEQPPSGAPIGAPPPIGRESRRVITEWAAATGRDLKARAKPVDSTRRQLVGAR